MARAPELGTGSSKQLFSFHNISRFATMPKCIGKHAQCHNSSPGRHYSFLWVRIQSNIQSSLYLVHYLMDRPFQKQ